MSERDPDKTLKVFGDLSETAIHEVAGVIKAMYAASKANPLMGIVSALYTADFLQKLGIMYPNTANALREAVFQAIGLNFSQGYATAFKAWESAIPFLGFFTTTTNIQYEGILKTSMTVDATGGEQIVKEAVHEAGETVQTLFRGEEGTKRLAALTKLLEGAM